MLRYFLALRMLICLQMLMFSGSGNALDFNTGFLQPEREFQDLYDIRDQLVRSNDNIVIVSVGQSDETNRAAKLLADQQRCVFAVAIPGRGVNAHNPNGWEVGLHRMRSLDGILVYDTEVARNSSKYFSSTGTCDCSSTGVCTCGSNCRCPKCSNNSLRGNTSYSLSEVPQYTSVSYASYSPRSYSTPVRSALFGQSEYSTPLRNAVGGTGVVNYGTTYAPIQNYRTVGSSYGYSNTGCTSGNCVGGNCSIGQCSSGNCSSGQCASGQCGQSLYSGW